MNGVHILLKTIFHRVLSFLGMFKASCDANNVRKNMPFLNDIVFANDVFFS